MNRDFSETVRVSHVQVYRCLRILNFTYQRFLCCSIVQKSFHSNANIKDYNCDIANALHDDLAHDQRQINSNFTARAEKQGTKLSRSQNTKYSNKKSTLASVMQSNIL